MAANNPNQVASKAASILAVDDSPDALELFKRHLEPAGYTVITATSAEEASRILKDAFFELVITDMKMPRVSGLDLIRHIRSNYKELGILMVTGYPSIGNAVEAVRLGAENYLAKPFTKIELLAAVQTALSNQRKRSLDYPLAPPPSGIIGGSEPMQTIFNAIEKAAAVRANVLITGESGTGKELVARAIHYQSDRASHPFVPVNCGGIPESLLESELFGHVKGAFTGATETRAGFFQTGNKGTIFLDEVGETSPSMQVKLLRVLQEKEICMVGSAKPQKIDVRIIAGTNKNLQGLIKRERFREDLFYRLNVINIELPPLRVRHADILLLLRYFSAKYAEEMGRPAPQYSDRALEILSGYAWPGNVRELENSIEAAVVLAHGKRIEISDFPSSLLQDTCTPTEAGSPGTMMENEARLLREVLEECSWNKKRAASRLGISRNTLYRKLKKYQINSPTIH